MSRFFSTKYDSLVPYTPGEQPKERKYVKLNTNESPFPPSPIAIARAEAAAANLQLYPDPECRELTERIAETYGLSREEVLVTNGSDEILNFAFMAFCDEAHPAVFADITYGFYSVFAALSGVPTRVLPLREDFSIDLEAYKRTKGTVFIANPNAPTGLALSRDALEQLVAADPDRVVVIDEAYVDFGAESCVPLIKKYDNLLVTHTFSKSRSMAGARLGYGMGCAALIADLNTVKYSTNPYNINSMTMAVGIGTLTDAAYTARNCQTIIENREYATVALQKLGFETTNSSANFIFARHPAVSGERIYAALRERGVLVRHFAAPRIAEYNRITVGTREQMDILLSALAEIVGDQA